MGRSPAYVLAFVFALGGAACAALLGFEETTLRNGDTIPPDGEGGTADALGPDGGSSALSVVPSRPVLRRGGSLELAVTVARSSESSGALTIALEDLPAGVTAAPLSLPPGTSAGTIKLEALAIATLGSKTTRLTVTGAPLAPLDVPLLVADPAGVVDNTFDGDGVAIDATKGPASSFYALAIDSDGSVLAGGAGNGVGPNAGWLLRRFNATGAADATFTANTATALPTTGEIHAIAIDATGRIVCAGTSTPPLPGQPVLTVSRITSAGVLDPTFAGGVVRIPTVETPNGSTAYGMAIQADGAIVVVGSRKDGGQIETGIALRFRADGARDPAFNAGATITIPTTRLVGVAVDATANILLAGTTTPNAAAAFYLARRTSAGAVDVGFGAAGATTFGNGYRANAAARLPNGLVAFAGDVRTGAAGYTIGLAEGKGGAVFARVTTPGANAAYGATAFQDDARVIAAGSVAAANGEARVDRLLLDGGGPDPSFGDAGAAVLDPGGAANGFDLSLAAAAVQTDGRILVAGNRSNAGAIVYRLWP